MFLGIDGGQSSTTALIGDDSGRVVGAGVGGPCNHVKGPGGEAKFVNAIQECVRAACSQAGIPEPEFHSICGGFSGGPADKEGLLKQTLHARQYTVTNDAVIALTGATGGEPGVVVIAGTGSIALGRNAARQSARAGGWGYIFGDEGGGFDLTRQALRAILRYEEGWGPHTSLHAALLEATGTASANELMHRFYTTSYTRPEIAAFSKLVDQQALLGDPVAAGILGGAAQQLASYAAAVRQQLFATEASVPVAYIGGVFRSDALRERFRLLVEMSDGCQVVAPRFSPAAGALLEAYESAGRAVRLSGEMPELKS